VLTMGTGMGFAVFEDGRLGPHLEMSQHQATKNKTYDEYVGAAALDDVGRKRWNRRMRKVIGRMQTLTNYDRLYIGGGNARHLDEPLPALVSIVPNEAGILGGLRLWDLRCDGMFEEHPAFA
jgi:polyphosphate glucokinase